MRENWEVRISSDSESFGKNVLIHRKNPAGGNDVLYFEGREEKMMHIPAGGKIPREVYVMRGLSDEILAALQVSISGLGIQTEQESTIRGKYEAQCEHLADLQHLTGWFMNGQRLPKPFVVPSGMTIADRGLGYARGPVRPEAKKG